MQTEDGVEITEQHKVMRRYGLSDDDGQVDMDGFSRFAKQNCKQCSGKGHRKFVYPVQGIEEQKVCPCIKKTKIGKELSADLQEAFELDKLTASFLTEVKGGN